MKTINKIDVSTLSNVPETMLIPLYLKAKETRESGIIRDQKSVEIIDQIDYDFSKFEKDWRTQISVAVRTIVFDEIVQSLSAKHKNLVIVNLGAGLDTREERFPTLSWYQLDLPQSIAIRKIFFPKSASAFISKSMLDFSWLKDIPEKDSVLFIAEGIFMYFQETEIRRLLEEIAVNFTHSFIAFNTIPQPMVGKKHSSVDTSKAPMQWGILSIKDIEAIAPGWKVNSIYYPLDYHKKRWRWMRLLTILPAFKKSFIITVLETEK